MIEAVGHEYWPTYFATIDRVLAPGGRAAIQAITMPHDRMLATRSTYTWINKYIFPGGFLPSVQVDRRDHPRAHRAAADRAARRSAQHYAETLRRWDEAFLAAARPGARRSASTRPSCGCGTSTWSTPAPASPRATSTSTSSPHARPEEVADDRVSRPQSRPPAAEVDRRPASRSGSRRRCAPSSAATCRCGCGPGTAPRPGRSTRRWSSCARPTPYAGCCGTRASSAPRRPTSPASSTCRGRRLGPRRRADPRVLGRARARADRRAAVAGRPRARGPRRGRSASAPLGRPPAAPARRRASAAGCTARCATGRAISHHYDLSNEFYSLILEESMAYSCGYHATPDVHARGGAARQARPGLPQARASSRA